MLFDIEEKVETPYLYQDGLFYIDSFEGWAILLSVINEKKYRLHIVSCDYCPKDMKNNFLTPKMVHYYIRVEGTANNMLNKFKTLTNVYSSSSDVPGTYTEFEGSKDERYNLLWG